MAKVPTTPPTPPGIPVLGHTIPFARDSFGFIRDSVETTGDVFRMQLLGKDVYVVAHPDHVATALMHRDVFTKLDDFEVAFGDALLSVEGEQWRRQRHAMEDFFDPTRIQDYAETMVDVTADRVAGWTPGDTIDVTDEMRVLALQNLFEVVLGKAISDAEVDDLADAAHALNYWFKPSTWALPNWIPTPARRAFSRGSERLRDQARSLLADTGDMPAEESLLARLATLRDEPNSGFDQEEVLDQVVGMIFAGHETTALAMTYALHQIGAHPEVADRFHAELDAVLDGRPTLADLQDLEYLDRILTETLRLYPPVHGIPRNTTERFELGEHVIPADAQVILSVWNMHRDPRFYDDPLTFDPERWTDTTPRDRGYEYIPFGSGPRICIGRHFSRLEMKAVLATVGRQYRLAPESDLVVSPQMTSQPDGPVMARLSERR